MTSFLFNHSFLPPPYPLPSFLGDAALAYARAQLPVFPLRPREKVPLIKGGFYAATTEEQQISVWWQRWPDANIGIPTGATSGWIALDVDPRHGGWASFKVLRSLAARAQVDLLATCCQRSGGGGIHLLFAFCEALVKPVKHARGLRGYAGIDLKGHGGYLAVAPSYHPSGVRYQWLRSTPLAPFPEVLLPFALPYPSTSLPVQKTPGSAWSQGKRVVYDSSMLLDMALARAREGVRHDSALFLACRLVEAGVPTDEAESIMSRYANLIPAGTHPFPEQEALACLAWARSKVMPSHLW